MFWQPTNYSGGARIGGQEEAKANLQPRGADGGGAWLGMADGIDSGA